MLLHLYKLKYNIAYCTVSYWHIIQFSLLFVIIKTEKIIYGKGSRTHSKTTNIKVIKHNYYLG